LFGKHFVTEQRGPIKRNNRITLEYVTVPAVKNKLNSLCKRDGEACLKAEF
jgi:hypothetical protein